MSILAHAPSLFNAEMKTLLRSLGYHATSAAAIVSWLEHRGRVDACPVVDPDDVETINAAAAASLQRGLEAEADRQALGHVETPAEEWPAWTDAHTWEPSEADRSWAAEHLAAGRPAAPAEAARAQAAAFARMVPAAIAEAVMARSLVGHFG